jgi:RNA polymerase sigma factor (sigma-70 family)
VTEPTQENPSDPNALDIAALLIRVQAGDREAAARLVFQHGPFLRARIRHQISPHVRPLFDTQDLMSTVARRLDQYVLNGRFRCDSTGQLLTLLRRIAEASVVDQTRRAHRLHKALQLGGADARFVARLTDLPETAGSQSAFSDDTLDRSLARIEDLLQHLDADERETLLFWLQDLTFSQMGIALNISANAAKKRWHRLRDRLIEILANMTDSR